MNLFSTSPKPRKQTEKRRALQDLIRAFAET